MERSAPARRRRMSPAGRRSEITDVAAALLAERGYWGLTMAKVAKEAGITVQGVLHHYPSKDDLMLAVLARRDELDFQAILPTGHEVRDVREFIGVVDELVLLNSRRRGLIQLYTVLAAESLSPTHPAHGFFNERFVQGVRAFARLAELWHDHPQQLGLEVLCALDGLQVNWLRDPRLDLLQMWRTWAGHYFSDLLTEHG